MCVQTGGLLALVWRDVEGRGTHTPWRDDSVCACVCVCVGVWVCGCGGVCVCVCVCVWVCVWVGRCGGVWVCVCVCVCVCVGVWVCFLRALAQSRNGYSPRCRCGQQ